MASWPAEALQIFAWLLFADVRTAQAASFQEIAG
jgi:hypothetical protein